MVSNHCMASTAHSCNKVTTVSRRMFRHSFYRAFRVWGAVCLWHTQQSRIFQWCSTWRKTHTMVAEKRYDVFLKNVLYCVKVSRNVNKCRSKILSNACPHNNTSASKSVNFLYEILGITFITSPVHTGSTISSSWPNKTVLHHSTDLTQYLVHQLSAWWYRQTGSLVWIPCTFKQFCTVWLTFFGSIGQ